MIKLTKADEVCVNTAFAILRIVQSGPWMVVIIHAAAGVVRVVPVLLILMIERLFGMWLWIQEGS